MEKHTHHTAHAVSQVPMRKLRRLTCCAAGLLTLLLPSCSRHDTLPYHLDDGHAYLPLQVGKYIEYQVDSVVYDPAASGSVADTSRTFFREVVADTFYDNAQRLTFRMERWERKADTLPWILEKIATATRTKNLIIRTEDNLPLIPLAFPLFEKQRWESTALFDKNQSVIVAGESLDFFKNWQSEVLSLDEPGRVGALPFDSVAVISHADDENLIELRYVLEKYARGVGLIFRELKILDTQCGGNPATCAGIPWELKAERGLIVRQSILGHN
jgi:hypothetical protein